MLKDDFYTITSMSSEGDIINATLVINQTHKIFEGHFPGQPVTPGVCLLQIVKEITAMILKQDLQLIKSDELKFLQVIDPRQNKEIELRVQYIPASASVVNILASIVIERVTCFKFKGSFRLCQPQQ